VKSTFASTLIDAARRGVILGKVENRFNRIRFAKSLLGQLARANQDLAHPGAPKFAIDGETTFCCKAGHSKVY
jgi:hypothetical protein